MSPRSEHKPHSDLEIVRHYLNGHKRIVDGPDGSFTSETPPSVKPVLAAVERLEEQYEGEKAKNAKLSALIIKQEGQYRDEKRGLLEQLAAAQADAERELEMARAYEVELAGLREQLEAAQKRLDWYEGLQGDANDADFAEAVTNGQREWIERNSSSASGSHGDTTLNEEQAREFWGPDSNPASEPDGMLRHADGTPYMHVTDYFDASNQESRPE